MTSAKAAAVSLEEIRPRLENVGQEHLLAFFDALDDEGRRRLLERLAVIEWERVPAWIETYVRNAPDFAPEGELAPAPYYPRDPASPRRPWDRERFRRAGEALLRDGKVAAFTVAGGQGTRLGFDGPKGAYPAGAVTGKTLFECLAEWILAARRRYDTRIPWCVMTSPLNHDDTVSFFRERDWLPPRAGGAAPPPPDGTGGPAPGRPGSPPRRRSAAPAAAGRRPGWSPAASWS